jgi:hypothetical protein
MALPVGCPLRGGRGEFKNNRTSVPPKTIKEQKLLPLLSIHKFVF